MEKYIKHLMFALIATLTIAFTACSDKDNDEPIPNNSQSLVGTWRCDNRYFGGPDYFTFKANGTYSWECAEYDTESGYYTFNNGLLTITPKQGMGHIYLIQFPNKNVFILTSETGGSWAYTKQ